jgi:hypothetical protein
LHGTSEMDANRQFESALDNMMVQDDYEEEKTGVMDLPAIGPQAADEPQDMPGSVPTEEASQAEGAAPITLRTPFTQEENTVVEQPVPQLHAAVAQSQEERPELAATIVDEESRDSDKDAMAESMRFGQIAALVAKASGVSLRDKGGSLPPPPDTGFDEGITPDAAGSYMKSAMQTIPLGARPAEKAQSSPPSTRAQHLTVTLNGKGEVPQQPVNLGGTVVIDPAIKSEPGIPVPARPRLSMEQEEVLFSAGWVIIGEWTVTRDRKTGAIEYEHSSGYKTYGRPPVAGNLAEKEQPAPAAKATESKPVAGPSGLPYLGPAIDDEETPGSEPEPLFAPPAKVVAERVEMPATLKAPVKKPWYRRLATVVVAAAGIAAGTIGAYYVARNNADETQQNTASAAATTPEKFATGVKVAQTASPKPTVTARVETQPQAPETTPDKTPATTPETVKEYKAPQTLVDAVTNPDLKKMLTDGVINAEFGKGGVGAHTMRAASNLIYDLEAHGKISPQKAFEIRQMVKQMAFDINVGQAGFEYDYYTAKSAAELNKIRSDKSHPEHEEFIYLESAWGPVGTWAAQLGGMDKRVSDLSAKEATYLEYEKGIKDQNGGHDINMLRGGDQIRPGMINLYSKAAEALGAALESGAKPGTPSQPLDLDNQWTDEPQQKDLNPSPTPAPAPTVAPQGTDIPTDVMPDGGKTGMLEPEDSPEIKVTGYTENADDGEIEVTWEDDDSPEITVAEVDDDDSPEIEVTFEDDDTPEIRVTEVDIHKKPFAGADAVRAANIAKAAEQRKKMDADLAEIEDGWLDAKTMAKVKAESLQKKIATITGGGFESRREALVERGEVFVPSLAEDINGSAMMAIKNGYLMACDTADQEHAMDNLLKDLRFRDMVEYETTEKGTYAKVAARIHLAAREIIKGGFKSMEIARTETVPQVREVVRHQVAVAARDVLKAA